MASKLELILTEQQTVLNDLTELIKSHARLATPGKLLRIASLRARQKTLLQRLMSFGKKHMVVKVDIIFDQGHITHIFTDISEEDAERYCRIYYDRIKPIQGIKAQELKTGITWA